jgi:hypothetical protein
MSWAKGCNKLLQQLTRKNNFLWLTLICLAMLTSGTFAALLYMTSIGTTVAQLEKKTQQLSNEVTSIKVTGKVAGQSEIPPNASNEQKSTEKELLEQSQSYNKDLLITVFFSLLGTVATIGLTIFGLNFFANFLSREQERKLLEKELQDFLQNQLIQERGSRREETAQQIFSLSKRMHWLEYKLSTVASDDAVKRGYLKHPIALQEKSRGIQILGELQEGDQSQDVAEQLKEELKILLIMLQNFLDEIQSQQLSSEDGQRHQKIRRTLISNISNNVNQIPASYSQIEDIKHILEVLKSA